MPRQHARGARLDLHNVSIDIVAAEAGWCGFTHLASGRVCLRPHRHPGSCHPQRTAVAPTPASSMRLR
jgi:hypothetical protein